MKYSLQGAIEAVEYLISGDCCDTQMDYIDEIEEVLCAARLQIPRKPRGEHYARMRCPSCNHRIPSGGGSSSRRADRWCNYCGQAIDWDSQADKEGEE